jgi:two-component system, cell cycle response regulator
MFAESITGCVFVACRGAYMFLQGEYLRVHCENSPRTTRRDLHEMDDKSNQARPIHDPYATTVAAHLDEAFERSPELRGRPAFPTRPTVASAPAVVPVEAEPTGALKLVVMGLKPMERQLLGGIVRVSQRRSPRLALVDDIDAAQADVVMVDTLDARAMAWAQRQSWLKRKPVIWLDATSVPIGHTLATRPVNWAALPTLLARALEQPTASVAPTAAPATPARAVAPLAATASAPALDQRRPILVVDDSLAVRAYLRSLLEARGFSVSDAASVRAALEVMTQRTFDCVLMDVLMPDVDGYEGCRQIKSRQRGASAVPVVMLTSKSSPFDRIRGKMAGCDAYLTKPVEPQQLSAVLQNHVRRADAQHAAHGAAPIQTANAAAALSRPTRVA